MSKIACVIYTYNKVEDAYIQMELIRKLRTDFDTYIIHVYNWWGEIDKYLADEVVYSDNPTGYTWAANAIDKGIEAALKLDIDYIYVGGSDCRWINPNKIKEILDIMDKTWKHIAACPRWNAQQPQRRLVGLSTDTFFITKEMAKLVFPLNYWPFVEKYTEILHYLGHNVASVEQLFAWRYLDACGKLTNDNGIKYMAHEKLFILKDRTPIILPDGTRHFNSPELWLYTDHNLKTKQQILIDNWLQDVWEHTREFVKRDLNR